MFLVGRSYADQPGGHLKAMAFLRKSLKAQPDYLAAKVWSARLQTISDQRQVRDVESGIAALDEIWKSTGERSWRLAMTLAIAYRNAQRSSEAASFMDTVLKLAPPDQHEQLLREFQNSESPRESSSTIQPPG